MQNGLPGPNVYYALQDSKGYIWLATDRGVSRFNGYEFENFDTDDGLPDNTVFEIFEDAKGRIWFAPFNLQLAYYENGQIVSYKHNATLAEHISPYQVASFIHVTTDQTVYLGVYENGVLCIDSLGNVSDYEQEDAQHSNFTMAFQIEGKTYPSSFLRPNSKQSALELIAVGPTTARKFRNIESNLSSKPVVAQLQDGSIVFGGRSDIIPWDKDSLNRIKCEGWILNLHVDKSNDLWVSLRNKGLLRYSNSEMETEPSHFLPNLTVTFILEDHEGGLWFCTEGSGLYYTPTLAISQYREGIELSSKNVNTLTIGKNEGLFIGYNDGNIDHITDKGIHTYGTGPKELNLPLYVRDMRFNEKKNRLQLISSGSLTELDFNKSPATFNTVLPNINTFSNLFRDSDEWLWMGNHHEIFGLSPEQDTQIIVSFETPPSTSKSSNRLSKLSEDANGDLLVGTYTGLFKLENGQLKHQGFQHPFFNSRITDIVHTENGTYIGSRTQGLALWKGDRVTVIDKNNGLASSQINAIAEDAKGNLWLATNSGIDQMTIEPDGQWNIQHYGPEHGLPAKEINQILVHRDNVWLGSTDGLLKIDLAAYRINLQAPPIHISSISINQEDTTVQDHYELDHKKNYLNIDFLGIAFRHGTKLGYQYRMVGVNNEWLYTQERTIQYPTLPHGDYRFEVLAQNEWGVLSENPASFSFHISPPWWETLLARGLLLFGLIAAVTAFFVLRLSAVKKREKERSALANEISEMKLKLLRAQMNPHFTFNTINSILDYISKNDRDNARNYLSKFALLLRYILESSNKALNTLTEELKALELYMQLEQFRFGDKLQYKITIGKNMVPEFDRIPTMLIQPLIENAILHGIMPKKTQGTVHLKIEKQNEFIVVVVEDDGVGRSTSRSTATHGHKSMSTGIVKDRLRLLNRSRDTKVSFSITDLTDTTGNPLGTRVQLQIAAN